ncbi:hypothetical protein Hanom_Chr03g00275431 [Helianthus anomalus]
MVLFWRNSSCSYKYITVIVYVRQEYARAFSSVSSSAVKSSFFLENSSMERPKHTKRFILC